METLARGQRLQSGLPGNSVSHHQTQRPTTLHVNMELLLTNQLREVLLAGVAQLPSELRQSIQAALDLNPAESSEPESTISHKLLVSLAKWSRTESAKARGKWLISGVSRSVRGWEGAHSQLAISKLTLLTHRNSGVLPQQPAIVDRSVRSSAASQSQGEHFAPPHHPLPHADDLISHPAQSPELEAILAQIQLSNDRKSYARMTALSQPTYTSTLPMSDPHDRAQLGLAPLTIQEEWADIKKQLAAVVNVLASMAAVATAVWWVSGGRGVGEVSRCAVLLPPFRDANDPTSMTPQRLALSMGGAIAISAIEAFLYWRYFSQEATSAKPSKPRVLKFDKTKAIQ